MPEWESEKHKFLQGKELRIFLFLGISVRLRRVKEIGVSFFLKYCIRIWKQELGRGTYEDVI